jgi:hypothetical protein
MGDVGFAYWIELNERDDLKGASIRVGQRSVQARWMELPVWFL